MNKCQRRQEEHDKKCIDTVIRILEKDYNTVLTHLPYWVHGNSDTHGELDIVAIRGKYMHVYEVKGRDSATGMRKAVYQLNEFERQLHNTTNLNNIIPKDVVLKKIYVSFDKQNNYVVRRLR